MTAAVTDSAPSTAPARAAGAAPAVRAARVPVVRGPGRRTPARSAVDVVCLLAALALALAPLPAVYGGVVALPAIVGGLLLGAAVAVASALWRWSAASTVAALVAVYAVAGGPLAAPSTTDGVVPTRETAEALLTGPAAAWKQVLTLQPPVGPGGSLLVAAFLLALVGAAVAVAVALRVTRPTLAASAALVPPAVLGAVVVLGTRSPAVPPVVTGTVMAVVLLVWAAGRSGTLRARRVVAVVLLVGVAAGAAVLGAPVVVGDTPRLVVRDQVVPPFDPRDYPSPLSAFRELVKKDDTTTLFTVQGMPPGARVRLATMDRYDGVVWNVAGDGAASSGEFRRVGELLDPGATGTDARVHVTIDALRGVWLPTVGRARSFHVDGSSAAAGLRYNDATGGAVLTGGVHAGLQYDLDVVVPTVPGDDEIGAAPAAAVAQPSVVGAPEAVAVTAADVARDAGSPVEIARALTRWLSEEGYFSHGVVDAGDYPSLSGHGADRITALLAGDVMVGDGEQYASALALLAREMGLPARVVLGFVPEADAAAGPVAVTGRDVQAWVEIAFAGHGWVPFDPTPPKSQTPQENDDPTPSDPDPQVVQPPPAPPIAVDPPDEDTEQPRSDSEEDRSAGEPGWYAAARVAGAVSVPVVLLAAPFLVVAVLRAVRRRRRRRLRDPVVRVAAGWDEVVDAAHDLRRPVAVAATRRESARDLAAAFSGGRPERVAAVRTAVHELARSADRVVFGPGEPDEATTRAYWSQVDATRSAMWRSVRRRTRWRARLSTASLRYRSRRGREASS